MDNFLISVIIPYVLLVLIGLILYCILYIHRELKSIRRIVSGVNCVEKLEIRDLQELLKNYI